MARKIIHQLIDDVDGSPIEEGQGETIQFGLDGKSYEIELTKTNADKLRDALAPFIDAGRVQARSGAPRQRGAARDLEAMRRWARENGFSVADRGRVSAKIQAAYAAR